MFNIFKQKLHDNVTYNLRHAEDFNKEEQRITKGEVPTIDLTL